MNPAEVYEALHAAVQEAHRDHTRRRNESGKSDGPPVLRIQQLDVNDLLKFDADFLTARHFADAEGIDAALSKGDITRLGKAMGITFEIDNDAPSRFGN